MIRRFLFLSIICQLLSGACLEGAASEPAWGWVKGQKTQHYTGTYGVQGVAAAQNWPGGRMDAVSMADGSGRFLVFGGRWIGNRNDEGFYNDLWRYDPATGQWTWLKGSRAFNPKGVYGVQGTPAAANTPGGRHAMVAWIDKSNRFWLFGGVTPGGNQLNDLWRFDQVTGNWTWVKGHNDVNKKGVYGVQGVAAPANMPGARAGSVSWTDSAGRFWLFGGEGLATLSTQGMLNDLWRFDPATGNWTWIKGSAYINQSGVYGAQGTAAPANTPGARRGAVSWLDGAGRLWLFGGKGRDADGKEGYLNDLWRYDPATNNWTWIKGWDLAGRKGVYGTRGTAAATNTPGARRAAVTWMDEGGRLWMFGGTGHDASDDIEPLNDLWRFDPATGNWTWIKGGKTIRQAGVYGVRGTAAAANTPGAHMASVAMCDSAGRMWLLGGYGRDASGAEGSLNDLWRFDPSSGNWTWAGGESLAYFPSVWGAMGAEGPSYTPNGRENSAFWVDASGQFWMLGGGAPHGVDDPKALNNGLWRFNPWSGNWACVKGATVFNKTGVYGVQGTPAAANMPGGRHAAFNWADDAGRLWLFGGAGYGASGGNGNLNDLWRYDPGSGHWTWMKGSDKTVQAGMYAAPQGVEHAANTPGGRWGGASWIDGSGRMWLFGGQGCTTTTQTGLLNDLWRYDPATNNWTWSRGSQRRDQQGVYGTRGTADSANCPGGRRGSVAWVDGAGQFWLFGGYGRDANGNENELNDLWRFNPALGGWVWVSGSNAVNQKGVYGIRGMAGAQNTPGARHAAAGWVDGLGRLCLFGGFGRDAAGDVGYLNDVWRYDPATGNWTWVKGGNAVNQAGVYGKAGTADPANTPGGRSDHVIWASRLGGVWCYGGYGFDEAGVPGHLNDVWQLQSLTSGVDEEAWRRLE